MAFLTWLASVIGSLRCLGKAKTLSGRSLRSVNSPCFSCGFQVVFIDFTSRSLSIFHQTHLLGLEVRADRSPRQGVIEQGTGFPCNVRRFCRAATERRENVQNSANREIAGFR